MKKIASRYGGILIGALYGLLMRFLFSGEVKKAFDFADLFSFTFIWIVPIIIGIIPLLLASRERLSSAAYRIEVPMLTAFTFLVFCLITHVEDLICIIIISLPFVFGAAISGFIVGYLILYYRDKKGILYSMLFIPVIAGSLENTISAPSNIYEVKTKVTINAPAEKIWSNVVRVNEIKDDEYRRGFFSYAGIPRPVSAELDKDTIDATRIGRFEGGLIFKETVTNWNRNKTVAFNIEVVSSSIRQTVFDQHILRGGHFKFLNASYRLIPIGDHQIQLVLSSSYQLDTHINFYGSFWGDQLLTDFQARLLEVIKNRCEK